MTYRELLKIVEEARERCVAKADGNPEVGRPLDALAMVLADRLGDNDKPGGNDKPGDHDDTKPVKEAHKPTHHGKGHAKKSDDE